MTTISTLEIEDAKKEGRIFARNIRSLDSKGQTLLYAKELCNQQANESLSGFNLCFIHDFGEHSGRYVEVLSNLISMFDEPVRVLLVDLYGHGKSSGTRGHIDSLDSICSDLIAFLNLWDIPIEDKISFFGVGLGGVVSLKINHLFFSQLKMKIEGIILINPGLKWRWSIPGLMESIGSSGLESLKKIKLPFELNGTLFCGESATARVFDADPLINHTMTWGTFLEVQRAASITRTSGYYVDIPVFLGISGKDSLYDHSVTELFARGISDCSVYQFEQAHHDLLHYFENEKVVKDVYNWIRDKFRQ